VTHRLIVLRVEVVIVRYQKCDVLTRPPRGAVRFVQDEQVSTSCFSSSDRERPSRSMRRDIMLFRCAPNGDDRSDGIFTWRSTIRFIIRLLLSESGK